MTIGCNIQPLDLASLVFVELEVKASTLSEDWYDDHDGNNDGNGSEDEAIDTMNGEELYEDGETQPTMQEMIRMIYRSTTVGE